MCTHDSLGLTAMGYSQGMMEGQLLRINHLK